MGRFQFLRRRLSRLFGWGRSRGSAPEPERQPPAQDALIDPVTGRPRFTDEQLADPIGALAMWLGTRGAIEPTNRARTAGVEALEARYGIRIPVDLRGYLMEIARGEDVEDDAMTTWWALGRIRNIPDEYQQEISNPAIAAEAGAYLFFADYMWWCWAWAVCCSDGPNRGRVAFIGGPDDFVADSFSEFVERYLRDPDGMANTQPRAGSA